MPDPRRALGSAGEELAAQWYQDHGYEVVARNWRCRDGELDLILSTGRVYVFCEVKTRSTSAFGVPAEAVTPSKQARIRRLAMTWLREEATGHKDIRFDVVTVLAGRLDVIEAAF